MTAAARLAHLPDWPGRLGEDEAAAYLGLSKSGFREKWSATGSAYPQPAREGGRIFWSRRQLDAWIDAQFGLAQPLAPAGGGRARGWAK